MKRLLGFLLACLSCSVALAVPRDYCRDVANNWVVPNNHNCTSGGTCGTGNSVWVLRQDVNGHITGSIQNYFESGHGTGEIGYWSFDIAADPNYVANVLGTGSWFGIDGTAFRITTA